MKLRRRFWRFATASLLLALGGLWIASYRGVVWLADGAFRYVAYATSGVLTVHHEQPLAPPVGWPSAGFSRTPPGNVFVFC